MNHSIHSADRATHLKVVIAVLLASTAIVATTLTARLSHPEMDVKATTQTVYETRPGHALTEIAQHERPPDLDRLLEDREMTSEEIKALMILALCGALEIALFHSSNGSFAKRPARFHLRRGSSRERANRTHEG